MGIVTSRSIKLTVVGVALAGAAFVLLFSNSQWALQSNNRPPTPTPSGESSPDKNSESVTTSSREAEVREMLRKNLTWSAGGHSMGTGRPYPWPTEKDAKKVFSQVTEADIPVLINIIHTYRETGVPLTVTTAEYYSARWTLALFKDKAKSYVEPLYEAAPMGVEKEKWKEVLRSIEIQMIEKPEENPTSTFAH